jgi:hypothetical protein
VKADAIAWEVIRRYKTQTEVAKKLKIIRQTFTYRINHAKTIHLEDILKMVQLLQSKKTETEHWNDFIAALFISERVKLAIDEKEKLGNRQGRKRMKNKADENLIRLNLDELNGRTDEYLAKKYGFTRCVLREAMRVVKHGCHEVIAAMDKGDIKIHLAAKLAKLPKIVQKKLLAQGLIAIRAYFNKKAPQSKQVALVDAMQAIKTDSLLKHIEKKTKAPIIKHIETILHSVCY